MTARNISSSVRWNSSARGYTNLMTTNTDPMDRLAQSMIDLIAGMIDIRREACPTATDDEIAASIMQSLPGLLNAGIEG